MSDLPVRICNRCRKVLDIRTDAFGSRYEHTMQDADDHEPVPVPMPPDWTAGRCDFCNAQGVEYELPVDDFTVPEFPGHGSVGSWAACIRCADLIRTGNWQAIEDQAIRPLTELSSAPVDVEYKVIAQGDGGEGGPRRQVAQRR